MSMPSKNMFQQSHAQTNLSREALIDFAIQRGEGEFTDNKALVVKTGKRTGRSPKDRFIVKDELTMDSIDWNAINQAISTEKFDLLWQDAEAHLLNNDIYFVSQFKVGAHPSLSISVNVLTELAWHNLFAKNLFINLSVNTQQKHLQDWTILNVPSFKTDPEKYGVHSDAAIILNFSTRRLLICGTEYAGEMKKGMFSVLNFLLPAHQVLPMHCAANASADGSTALFFGLSGTGKTTLSADPDRFLIGDDEHGWSEEGVYNFEGGCYAKCIDLSQEREPLIWDAIKYGTVLENVIINSHTKTPDFSDTRLTQNTRAAYPLDFIPKRVQKSSGKHPQAVIFLTCDLYGVLPPVALLNEEQAAYYFLSGYTALVGSTEVGEGSGIKPTFSTCFGAPFFPRPPGVYADLLQQKLRATNAKVYLVNTGWTGGAFGQGQRFSIPTTRAIVSAILNGELNQAEFEIVPDFNFKIPKALANVDANLLNPIQTWENKAAYHENKKQLISLFINNFKRFKVAENIRNAGPESS